jgi:FkbM family methyltransferase
MNQLNEIRRNLTWLAHCFKAVTRTYHHQLLPVCSIILKQDDLVIDVGAHAGQLTKIFSRRARKGLVLAVEPASYPLSILRVVQFLHRLHSVKIINVGVGKQRGEAILQTPLKISGVVRFGLSHVTNNESDTSSGPVRNESISITTIDALVEEYGNDLKFALLKADIEGFEYEMLCGAIQSIEASRPCLLLEISKNRKKIMDFLWQREYVVFNLLNYSGKKKEHLRLAEIPYQSESNARNILAVNSSRHEIIKGIKDHFF